jgi:hypothetical protein
MMKRRKRMKMKIRRKTCLLLKKLITFNVTVFSHNGTDTVLQDFTYSDFDFDDCTADDFPPQDLIAPDAPIFDYTTDNEVPDYFQPPALPRVRTKQSACSPDQKHLFLYNKLFFNL